MENPEPVKLLVPNALKSKLSRRLFLSGALGVGAAGVLAACASGASSSGPLKKQINMYTWGDYDDPKVLKQWGTVKLDSYGSNEEMIAKLVATNGTSGYDVIVPTGQYIPQMVKANLLEKLDHSLLPNMKNLDPGFVNLEYDKGNVYSVPKAWGATGYLYDTTKIKRELKTWSDFWDAAANEAKGSTSLVDDPGEISAAYFISKGIPVTTTKTADLDAYRKFILGYADSIQAFESYPSATISSNGRTLAQAWNGDARQGILGNKTPDRYKWVLPSDGSLKFQDNWCIPKGAPNVQGAHNFLNFVLDPTISLKELLFIGYGTGVKDIEAKAKATGMEYPEMVFFTAEQIANFKYPAITSATEVGVKILSDLKAKIG